MTGVALAPLPGEIDSIVARVHRRRQADVAGAIALSFAVLLGSATLFRGGSTHSLQPTTPSITSAPSPSAPTSSPAAPARRDTVRPPVVQPVRQAAPRAAEPAAPPTPTPSGAARDAMKPRVTTGYLTRPSGLCDPPSLVPGSFDSGPACLDVRVDSTPGVATFRLYLCTYEGQTVQNVEFPTAQEVDFVVRRDGADLWTWSAGQRFGPEGRTIQLSGDTCYVWSVAWDGTAEDGRALSPGTYTLHGISLAEDNGGPRGKDTTFTLE